MKLLIKGKKVEAKLPIAFKKKLVKALRSGDYLQAEGVLNDDKANQGKGGNCCLGVACKVIHPKLDVADWGYIDAHIAKKARNIPFILKGTDKNNELVSKLTSMNDSGKWSFNRIATYIERYL